MPMRTMARPLCLALLLLTFAACEEVTTTPDGPTTPTGPTLDGGTTPAGGDIDPTPEELASGGSCSAATGAGTTHEGSITADETWTAAAGPHRITQNLSILGTVTIEPCAVVEIGAGKILTVGSTTAAGRLVAQGTAKLVDGRRDVRPVTFRAADASAKWGKLFVNAKATVDLAVTALRDGGGETTDEQGTIVASGEAGGTNDAPISRNLRVDRVLVEGSGSYGVNLAGWGAFVDGSDKLWIRNGGSPTLPSAMRIEPGVASTLPKTLAFTGNVRDEILLRTNKAFMRTDTFVARGVPYRASSPLYVNPSADGAAVTLTLEAGVTLGFDANAGIVVGSSDNRLGNLVAVGTPAAPVVFTSAKEQKVAGDWANINFRYSRAGESRIDYARVEYAGGESGTSSFGCGPADNDSAIIVQGQGVADTGPAASLIDHTTFSNIAGTTVIVSGWTDDSGPNLTNANTFGAGIPGCRVSRPQRTGGGDTCDGGRTTCW